MTTRMPRVTIQTHRSLEKCIRNACESAVQNETVKGLIEPEEELTELKKQIIHNKLSNLLFDLSTLHINTLVKEKGVSFRLQGSTTLYLHPNGFYYVDVSFASKSITQSNGKKRVIEAVCSEPENGSILEGKLTYKIDINSFNNIGWTAKLGLVEYESKVLEIYKDRLDARNILQIIIDFFTLFFNKIIKNNSSPSIRVKPFFIFSNDGRSLENPSFEPPTYVKAP